MDEYSFKAPEPIVNEKEIAKLEKLSDEYKKFIEPGKFGILMQRIGEKIGVPKIFNNAIKRTSELDMIKKALEIASKGFLILQNQASKLIINKKNIVKRLTNESNRINKYEQICALRSYDIEKVVGKQNYKDLFAAFTEGAISGSPGLIGVPFNIVLSFLFYFRATQSIALHYGYDVINDPSELEFASTVTTLSLSPSLDKSTETLTGLIGKMMLAAEFTALRSGLNKTYMEMAEKGGIQLLFVQIRALANKAAEKALQNAGEKDIEAGIFKNLLEQVGKMLSKDVAERSLPIVGALVGGFSDTYFMNRVIKCANLIYHKRFILEKEQRVNELIKESY